MSEYNIINEKRFPLKVRNSGDNSDLLPYYRWEHRVTMGYRGRRFMCFIDNLGKGHGPIVYIEEITSGSTERIKDESLFESLVKFATEKGFLNVIEPIWKDVGYKTNKRPNIASRGIKV